MNTELIIQALIRGGVVAITAAIVALGAYFASPPFHDALDAAGYGLWAPLIVTFLIGLVQGVLRLVGGQVTTVVPTDVVAASPGALVGKRPNILSL